jgi:hypothetical protein
MSEAPGRTGDCLDQLAQTRSFGAFLPRGDDRVQPRPEHAHRRAAPSPPNDRHPLATPRGRSAALLVVAHLRNGETYPDLAGGFGIGTTTVFRYIREALDVLAALAAALSQAIEAARRKAFVILDGTLLRIDRVGMGAGRDRPYYSGRHKCLSVRVSSPLLRWLGILTAGDLALQVPAAFGLAHARVVPIAGGQGRPT